MSSSESVGDAGVGQGRSRRKSSASNLDKEKLARLQALKGSLASKLLKMKVTPEESAAAAISLSKVMARKKGAELLQIDIETEAQWKLLLRKEGLIVVEVYSSWCGPCLSMATFLKKVKIDTNDDRLTLASVNSEHIADVRVFRGQSEPTWIFMGGGKPVRLVRGPNSSTLAAAIKSEFQHELLCMEGKAKRNLISLKDEAERGHKAKSEAILLASIQKKEEEEQAAIAAAEAAAAAAEEKMVTETLPEKRNVSPTNSEYKERAWTTPETEPEVVGDDLLLENETLIPDPERVEKNQYNVMVESLNNRLLTLMDSYAVLAIQGFLLETGAVTEIKDLLKGEFIILRERYIFLDDAGVRRLYGIPSFVNELIEEVDEEPEAVAGSTIEDGEGENSFIQDNLSETGVGGDEQPQGDKVAISDPAGSEIEGDEDNKPSSEVGEDAEASEIRVKPKPPRYRQVPIPLPPDLPGDSLLFLLQSVEVVKVREQDPDATLAKNADDLLRFRVGPSSFANAVDNEPKSLLAIYGREEYGVGVWCPRKVEDKKYVMLNYFPKLVAELLMPPPKEMPKYCVAIFPALFSNEIMEHSELVANVKDVIAQGKMKLSPKFVDRILKSHGQIGEDLEPQKKALTGFDMFAVSIDERNEALTSTLTSLEPLHTSVNEENGRYETAKLFPYLNILIDNDFEDELYRRDLIVEKFLARPKFKLNTIFDDDMLTLDEGGGGGTSPVPP